MEPSTSGEDDFLERAIRQAAPAAPRALCAGVMARIEARRRARRAAVGCGALLAAAAALVLWTLGRPPAAPIASGWQAAGRVVAVGATVRGPAALSARGRGGVGAGAARVRIEAAAEVRVGDGALRLSSGSVRLEGPGARVAGDAAVVTALGEGADVAVEQRRSEMTSGRSRAAAAVTSLLSVVVYGGGARVEARGHAPILLAKHDRALVAPKLPPLTVRAPRAMSATVPLATPAEAPDRASDAAPAKPGALDKDAVRAAIRATMDDVRACYEAALAQDADAVADGRLVVQMKVVDDADGRHGHVREAEIAPSEGGAVGTLEMQQCILQAISRATFPPSANGGEVTIRYPFLFRK